MPDGRKRYAVAGGKRRAPARGIDRQGAQRRDVVQDVESAAMRGDDEIVAVHLDVAHRGRRQAVLQRLPGRAVVERDEDAALGAGEEQAAAARSLRAPH